MTIIKRETVYVDQVDYEIIYHVDEDEVQRSIEKADAGVRQGFGRMTTPVPVRIEAVPIPIPPDSETPGPTGKTEAGESDQPG